MVSGIRFLAASGAYGNTIASLQTAGKDGASSAEIFQLEAGATNSPNRLGFFGAAGAPSSPVIVGAYQDRSHITDHVGTNLGHLVNTKYTGAMTAEVSGVNLTLTGHTLDTIPPESGTVLLRFQEPTGASVATQNGVLRAIDLTAASGAPVVTDLVNGVTVQASQLSDGIGHTGDTSWTQISDGGGALTLADQATEMVTHDWSIIISASPDAAGRKIDWGFYAEIEYL
jgi:hypothetical protein